MEEFFLADGEVDFIVVKKVELQHHQKCHSKFKKAAIFNSVFFTSEVPTAPANVLSFYPTHSLVSNLPVLHQVFRI